MKDIEIVFFSLSVHCSFKLGYGRREVVELLLANGASIQACDEGGLHPLHNACSFGHADVVRLLLEAGASPNTTDNWNYTPLHEAAQKGKIDVCIGMYNINITFQTYTHSCAAIQFIFTFEFVSIKSPFSFDCDSPIQQPYCNTVQIQIFEIRNKKRQ